MWTVQNVNEEAKEQLKTNAAQAGGGKNRGLVASVVL